jgi:hypothetical protein
MEKNYYKELAAIDVSKYVEKKGPHKLSYLSWPYAVDQLMRQDPAANWEFHRPEFYGDTVMVSCTVTAFGKPITMHLPVMDQKNQAAVEPDAVLVNKNMMRCLVKAIACHGLGIALYSGEDLPSDEPKGLSDTVVADYVAAMKDCMDLDKLSKLFASAYRMAQQAGDTASIAKFTMVKDQRKTALEGK